MHPTHVPLLLLLAGTGMATCACRPATPPKTSPCLPAPACPKSAACPAPAPKTEEPTPESRYMSSNFRVIFMKVRNQDSVPEQTVFVDLVQLVVATDRKSPDTSENDSQCGSIYSQPTCYFFIEPRYIYGAPEKPAYLGELTNKGAFQPGSVRFVPPDQVEFKTAEGDAGDSYEVLWRLNLKTGKFTELRVKTSHTDI